MKKQLLAGAGVVILVGAALAAAQTQPQPPAQGMRGARPDRAAIEREIGLSQDQEAQLHRLSSEERKTAIRQHADLAIARMELQEALDAQTVDEKLVAAKVKAVSELEASAVRARVDHRLAMRKILTPEQQQKMRQLAHARRPGRGFGPMRDGRGPRPRGAVGPQQLGPGGPGFDEIDGELVEPGR